MDISTLSVYLYYGNHKHQARTIDEKGNDMVNFCPAQDFLPRIQTNVGVLKEKVESAMKSYKDFRISEGKEMIKSIGRGFPIVVSSTPKETEALYSLRTQ
nr:hypothetical protein CFP56_21393 [Quercus suber]